ncbi:MAG: hypothetical protein KAJ19_28005, partial [Gammaproteobacteria bacterium]|nr:hypothetical protein [Gammaproteobacteria bacterium]
VDDNGLLTVSGATFTMDQLIIDSDNTEAILVRKDGDAGDVFIVDTVNDVVRLGSNDTFLTFGASSDARLERFGPRILGMREPGVGGVGLGAGGENTLRLYARDDGAGSAARWLELMGDGPICLVKANRATGGGQFDLNLDVSVGKIAFFNEGVQRWNIQGSVTADFEFAPFITNRYDLGSAALAVRNLYTNGVLIGQDQVAAYDAITIDGTDLAAPGQQDSGAIILTGLSNDGSAHDIDWKQFVNVTANDGTGSIFTIQARIDAASFVDEFTITATTSPTLAHIGPGSTDGALAFGPIGAAGPAQSGTIRFRNTDDVRWRNSGDDDDNVWFSIGASDQLILGETTSGPFIGVVPGLRAFDSIECTSDTGNLTMSGASLSPIIFKADGANQDVTIGEGVVLLPSSSVDRLNIDAPNLTVNSTVGFSHTFLMVGKSREAGGANHDSNWRMFVEPLTGTGFDGQSVFKITAAIDGAGPTTVFTLSDTGDLIVPGSFTIDGLIIDVTSTEAFLVRKNADAGDVFNVDTSNDLVQLRGGAALEIGSTPSATGSIRLSNADSIVIRNSQDNGDIVILVSPQSDEFEMFDATVPRVDWKNAVTRFEQRVQIQTPGLATSTQSLLVGNPNVFIVDTTNGLVRLVQNDTALTFGTASDVQLHRGDGADILEQRRGANDQRFNLYENFVSNADYDRLAFYIGGGPPVITAEIAAETTNGAQRIDMVLESAGSDSNMTFQVGSASSIRLISTGSTRFMDFTPTALWDVGRITSLQPRDVNLNRRINIGRVLSTPTVDAIILAPDVMGGIGTRDSHGIEWTARSQDGGQHDMDFRIFVNAVNNNGTESIMKVQSRIDAAGFLDIVHMVDGGRFAIVQPEQVSIGSPTFIDNAQVHITGAFIDDYGGGPTSTHKILVDGSLTGDATRTTALNIAEFSGSVITQTATENISTVSQVEINEPNITDNLTGSITSAQSLLITGAPTEGVRNYAFRILTGDLVLDENSSAILFDVSGTDLSALSVAPTGRLELGLSAAPWGRINLYSQIINNIGGDLRIVATAANHSA